MPLPAAEDGASRDPAQVLHTGVDSVYLRVRLGVTFDADSVALEEMSRTVDGNCTEEVAAISAINAVAGACIVHRVLGVMTAVECFKAEQTYGGNESRRISVDGRL